MATRKDRILRLLGDLDKETLELVDPLVSEVAWLEARLAATRTFINAAPVVLHYDNGGGQTGFRRNPAYDGYHALFKSYTLGLRTLRELTGVNVKPNAEKPGKLADMRKGSPLFKAV